MPIPRIFQPIELLANTLVRLDAQASHHIRGVLRIALGEKIFLFNGKGGEYLGEIVHLHKKEVMVRILSFDSKEVESPIEIFLAQGLARSDKMDMIIKKAVELGVKKIIPVLTERSQYRLSFERQEKRITHWQSIIISACEQCGRNQLPSIYKPLLVSDINKQVKADKYFVLDPKANAWLPKENLKSVKSIVLFVGPEGGLTPEEVASLAGNFYRLSLGPRILRTETAALAAIALMQACYGDMGAWMQ